MVLMAPLPDQDQEEEEVEELEGAEELEEEVTLTAPSGSLSMQDWKTE